MAGAYVDASYPPLDQAERAKMAAREENTKNEIAELRGLLEKYLRSPVAREEKATG